MKNECVVGIDLGGTKVEACLIDSRRKLLNRYREPTEALRGMNHVIEKVIHVMEETTQGKTFSAVGIGTPGTYVADKDCLYGAPHTPVYEDPGLIGGLKSRLSVPVVVDNDANCLALAEYYASCEGRYRHVMAVIMGTGVGSGLILDGKLYRGAEGGAGEIGHASIDLEGRICECGRKGCLEAYLSGPSLSRRFHELSGEKLTVPEIYSRYQQNDPHADHLIKESCRIMGEAFANVANILDLDAIILGGGVSNLPVWYDRMPPEFMKFLFGFKRAHFPFIKAKLGDSAGVFGAAYLALRERGFMSF